MRSGRDLLRRTVTSTDFQVTAAQLTQYTYDAFGQRIVKVGSASAATLFQYDQGGHLLEQTRTGSAQVDYIYLGDRPLATFQPSNKKMYFLHDDQLGTPQRATDSTQAVAWGANYQPFGYTSTGIGLIVQNLRLPGQEFEVETWWNHNGFRDYAPTLGRYLEADPIGIREGGTFQNAARFYNTTTGRFISEDPIGFAGGANLYSYVRNNPTAFTDPSGLATEVYLTLERGALDTSISPPVISGPGTTVNIPYSSPERPAPPVYTIGPYQPTIPTLHSPIQDALEEQLRCASYNTGICAPPGEEIEHVPHEEPRECTMEPNWVRIR